MNPKDLARAVARRSLAYAQPLAQGNAEGAMNSLVLIQRPAEGTYDEDTREYGSPALTPVYDDPDMPGYGAMAGITPAEGPITMNLGDEPQYYSSVTIYIPARAARCRIDDVVLVMANPDPDLVERYFRIIDVPDGGRINASQALSATGIAPSRAWTT